MSTIIRSSGGGGFFAYELSVQIPTGVRYVDVERTGSGLSESALLGEIEEGDIVYSGDTLVTTGVASNGFAEPTGITYTVKGKTVATVEVGDVLGYSLAITKPTGVSTLTVVRTSSPLGGSLGEVDEDSDIYYGDVLLTSGTGAYGYGDPSGITYTVTGDTTVTINVGAPTKSSFANATWEEVKEVADDIRNGVLEIQTTSSGYKYVDLGCYVWIVGRTKTLTIDDTDYTVRIVDFQHWTDENSGWEYGNTDAINMELTSVYSTARHNSSNEWSGLWSASGVYSYLTEGFFNLLPSDFSDNLLNVTVQSSQGRSGPASIVTTNGKCNLPSMTEVGLGSHSGCSSYEEYEDCYELNYYSANNDDSSRVKNYNSSAGCWWTRTPSATVYSADEDKRLWSAVLGTGGGTQTYVSEYNGVSPIFSY